MDFIFCGINKNAHSTMRNHIKQYSNFMDIGAPLYLKEGKKTLKDIKTKNPKTVCFTIVRNPWDRLVSGYFFTRQVSQGPNTSSKLKQLIEKCHRSNFKECIMSFPDIKTDLEKQKTKESEWLQTHLFSYQYEFMTEDLNELLRFENLESEWLYFSQKYKLDYRPIKQKIMDSKRTKHFSKFYDKEMVEYINKYIEKDTEFLNYPSPLNS
jgi:hypothetical protein